MKQDTIRVGAVIAAGGMAQRMQGVDKQLLEFNGVPVLVRSIQALAQVRSIQELVVVARQEQFAQLQSWKEQYHLPDFVLTTGGATRQQSVQAGIAKLSEQVEYFVIHDGARPFAQPQMIERCIQAAVEYGAATAAVRVKDTIKQANEEGFIEQTPDRSRLYLTQTPQVFEAGLYRRAVKQAQREGLDFTDDCQLVEHIGHAVKLCEGDYRNIKITTPEDIAVAKAMAGQQEQQEEKRMEIRTGHGYDVHRLTQGRKLILGGVEIPWEKGLLGHSDADVLVHAVMDALLGAAALGDIGRHFPDTDPRYAGADSICLLKQVVLLLKGKGYSISNIDSTIIAQRPKMRPYIDTMRENIAKALKIESDQINVKATTEEGLGFTGSGEGISSQAICMLEKVMNYSSVDVTAQTGGCAGCQGCKKA